MTAAGGDGPALDDLMAAMPFAQGAGVRLLAARPGEVVAQLDWAPERCTAGGVLHGGALMTLADSAGAVCAFLNLAEGATTSTISTSTSLLRAVTQGTVTATSTPLKVGRRVITVQTTITDEAGDPVAVTTQAQAVLS